MTAEPHDQLPIDQQPDLADDELEPDHSNCIQPHRTADGYVDYDGRPL
ncbi:hypothetical protein ACIRYZ_21860 [Kitasatospora sp. NPDC101155]